MSARCSLVVNGKSVRVATGDTPLDAAVEDGMIAYAQATHGAAVPGQGASPGARRVPGRRERTDPIRLALPAGPAILAQAEEPAPAVAMRTGTVTDVRALTTHVIELVVTVNKDLPLGPGAQVALALDGVGLRTLCPTLRVDGSAELNELVFHLARDEDGWSLADSLPLHANVKVRGPVGRAQYRPGGGRLVLVSAGCGFGQIWSIARAARYIEPTRDMCVVVGARDPLDLYMRESLEWLRATGVGRIVLSADRSRQRPPDVRPGPLTAHLPALRATDVVHVAGDSSTVGAVQVLAAAVGARCYPVLVDA